MKKFFYVSMIGLSFISCTNQQQKVPAVIRVHAETVTAAQPIQRQHYVGIVEEEGSTIVSYASLGTLHRLWVDEGQSVSRGQLLAEVDDTQAKNKVLAAEAQSRQMNDALERARQLYEKKSLTESKWVEIQSQFEQVSSQLEMAKKGLRDCRIVAPCSGIIGKRYVDNGETLMPAQPVVSILCIDGVKVRVSIPEQEISGIQPNTSSRIQVEAIGVTYEGGKITKGITSDAVSHTYDIKIALPNPQKQLLPGMVARVMLEDITSEAASPSALMVPVSGVQQQLDGSRFVWTIAKDQTAHRTVVIVGECTGNRIAVLSGLHAGDQVVTRGYHKLSEGSRVARVSNQKNIQQ